MSFIRKMRGLAIINDIQDTEAQVLAEPVSKSKKKKGNQSKQTRSPPPTELPPFDPMADLTEEAGIDEKSSSSGGFKKTPSCMDHLIFHDKLRILYVVLLCLALGLAVPYILSSHFDVVVPPSDKGYCGLNVTYRMQCLPGRKAMKQSICYEANCCYEDVQVMIEDTYAPRCFHTIPADYNYIITNSSEEGYIVTPVDQMRKPVPLAYPLGQDNFTLEMEPLKKTTPEGKEAWPLKVLVQRQGEDVVRIKIWNPDHVQDIDDDFVEDPPSTWKLDVVVNDAGLRFNISVTRNETGEEIFNTVFGPLIFSEDYIELTSRISTNHLYGFGQRANMELNPDFVKKERWALYNFNDQLDDVYTYGSHPFYMNFERSGLMHGVYLRNAGPVEAAVNSIPAVFFRPLGGSLDLRFFAGPTPHDVSRQYTGMIGLPAMPPFWALGYHLCRTSSSSADFDGVFDNMTKANLPYESDCVNARLTYPGSFTKLSDDDNDRISALQGSGRKFWLVQHPFVTYESKAYTSAQTYDILLKVNSQYSNETGVSYFGKIGDEAVGYPDFVNEQTFTWMNDTPAISELYKRADGVMLFQNSPMNEARLIYGLPVDHFCNETFPKYCCPAYKGSFLPEGVLDLNNNTLCADLQQPTLLEEASLHLRAHNTYGLYQHQRTYDLKRSLNTTKRPLISSQSTFPGSGNFGGSFGGNYRPTFAAQRIALVHILQMGLYGVPLTGVPICGSTNNTDDDLNKEWCIRGHQVGAFLPFLMSHYEQDHAPRNPPNLPSGTMEQLKYYIRQRYMLLPYIYNLFREASTYGTPVARPLFYEFPEDEGSRTISKQFMLGNSILVTPVIELVEQGGSAVTEAHFPPACWYDFYKGNVVSRTTYGEDLELPTLLTDSNAHIRGGTIIPMQGNLHEDFNTTTDFRLKPLIVLVALPCDLNSNHTVPSTTEAPVTTEVPETLNEEFTAFGELYMDDGETPLDQNPPFHSLSFKASNASVVITRLSGAESPLCPDGIGFTTEINEVHIYGLPVVSEVYLDRNIANFTQDVDSKSVSMKHLNINWCETEISIITWVLGEDPFSSV